MAGSLDSLFGGIKSVQRGEVTLQGAGGSGTGQNVSISSVDMAKSVVIINYSSGTADGGEAKAVLTTSTNLNIARQSVTSSTGTSVAWQVVESN